jgi:HSP20 family protein
MSKPSGNLFADFAQLQDRIDELLGGSRGSSSIRAAARDGVFPALNVGTWAEALEIYAFAPGIDPGSIDVLVEKRLLTISGERAAQPRNGPNDVSVYAKERFDDRFRRVVSVPEDSDPARVEASHRNGVLEVIVPRHESAKPRQISVNG